nr:MAG: hypothetical protein [Marsupenaeus japonicus pemonivirus]
MSNSDTKIIAQRPGTVWTSQVRYNLRPRHGTTGLTASPSNTTTSSKTEPPFLKPIASASPTPAPSSVTAPATTGEASNRNSATISFAVTGNSDEANKAPQPTISGSRTFDPEPQTRPQAPSTGPQTFIVTSQAPATKAQSFNARQHQTFIVGNGAPTATVPPSPSPGPQTRTPVSTTVSNAPNAGFISPNVQIRRTINIPQTITRRLPPTPSRLDEPPPFNDSTMTERRLAYECFKDAYIRYKNIRLGSVTVTPLECLVLAENFRVATERYNSHITSNPSR